MHLRLLNCLILFSLIVVVACSESITDPAEVEPSRWEIKPDSVNIAVLILDYLTYDFEGGYLSYYEPCNKCSSDSIPFDTSFETPMDVGWMLFSYAPTGDTIFYSTAIYMGEGEIEYPENYLPYDSFTMKTRRIAQPLGAEYYDYMMALFKVRDPSEDAISAMGLCWAAINRLDIVNEFDRSGHFRVAYLACHRVWGNLDIRYSKWVVFLFRENIVLPQRLSNCRLQPSESSLSRRLRGSSRARKARG